MNKKQYNAVEITIMEVVMSDILSVSLGEGEKGVWDDEIFGN